MARSILGLATVVVTWFAGVAMAWSATPYQHLLCKVPSDANSLVMISTAEVRASAVAKREVATDPGKREAVSRHIFAMPTVDYSVLASHVNLDTLSPLWELGLYAASAEASLPEIAKRHKGRVETIGDQRCVWLPQDAHLFKLGSQMFGLINPANRQFAARWLRQVQDRNSPQLSPYLQEASSYPDNVGTEIILALDLEYAVSRNRAQEGLKDSRALQGQNVDRNELASVLASVRGVTLGVRTGERLVGKLRVDFAHDPSMMAAYAKPLLLEILAELGASLNDFSQWTAEIRGNTVFLGGELSVKGLQRILSIVDPPAPDLNDHRQDKASTGVDPKAAASLRNFRAVQEIVEDARNPHDIKTWGNYAKWLEQYAKKIDHLPILDVDSDLLDYRAKVANLLRDQAHSYKLVGFAAGRESHNVTYETVAEYWGPWFSSSVSRPGLSDNAIARKDAAVSAAENQATLLKSLDEATARMRRLLTERYGIEF